MQFLQNQKAHKKMAIDFNTDVNFSVAGTNRINIPSTGGVIMTNSPVYVGRFSSYTTTTSNYAPALITLYSRNVTVDTAASKITVPTAGLYYVYVQQLVNTSGAVYLNILKNGVVEKYAYSDNDSTYDMAVGCVLSLAANEYVSFSYTGTTTYTWTDAHTSVTLYHIG